MNTQNSTSPAKLHRKIFALFKHEKFHFFGIFFSLIVIIITGKVKPSLTRFTELNYVQKLGLDINRSCKGSTVPFSIILSVVILVPLVPFLIYFIRKIGNISNSDLEFISHKNDFENYKKPCYETHKRTQKNFGGNDMIKDISQEVEENNKATFNIKVWIRKLSVYYCFLGLNIVVVNVLKVLVSEPRPDFYSKLVKKPEMSNSDALKYYQDLYKNDVTTLYNLKEYEGIKKSLVSFPSGHTGAAFFFCLFCIAVCIAQFLNIRNRRLKALLIILTPILFMGVACFVGCSRVYDNKHHITDVIAGAVLGCFLFLLGSKSMVEFK